MPLDAQAPSSGRCLEAAKLLPAGLRTGSVVVPSADGINENVLLMLHGLGDTPGPYVGEAHVASWAIACNSDVLSAP